MNTRALKRFRASAMQSIEADVQPVPGCGRFGKMGWSPGSPPRAMWALAWVAVCASARFAPAAFSNSSRRLGKKVDTYEAWVERWRSEGSERCRAPKESREADVCEWLRDAGPVDVGCRFEVLATGLAPSGVSAEGPALWVASGDAPERKRPLHADPELGARVYWDKTIPVPSLCAYGFREAAPRPPGGVVAVVAASSVEYVFRSWGSLVNKVAYFGAMDIDWHLWIGDLDPRLASKPTKGCAKRLENDAIAREHVPNGRDSVERPRRRFFHMGDAFWGVICFGGCRSTSATSLA